MLLLPSGGEALHLPTRAREVFDVTGAGDTVIALLAAGIASGMKLTDAAGVANMAAGMVVAKLGAGSVTLTELRSALRQQENWGPVVDRQQLKLLLEEARTRVSVSYPTVVSIFCTKDMSPICSRRVNWATVCWWPSMMMIRCAA